MARTIAIRDSRGHRPISAGRDLFPAVLLCLKVRGKQLAARPSKKMNSGPTGPTIEQHARKHDLAVCETVAMFDSSQSLCAGPAANGPSQRCPPVWGRVFQPYSSVKQEEPRRAPVRRLLEATHRAIIRAAD